MVAGQIPNDPDWSEVILASQVEDLFNDFWRCLSGRVLGDRLGIDQALLAPGFECGFPPVETCPSDAEVTACLGDVSDLLSVSQDLELVLNNPFFAVHAIHSPGCR